MPTCVGGRNGRFGRGVVGGVVGWGARWCVVVRRRSDMVVWWCCVWCVVLWCDGGVVRFCVWCEECGCCVWYEGCGVCWCVVR